MKKALGLAALTALLFATAPALANHPHDGVREVRYLAHEFTAAVKEARRAAERYEDYYDDRDDDRYRRGYGRGYDRRHDRDLERAYDRLVDSLEDLEDEARDFEKSVKRERDFYDTRDDFEDLSEEVYETVARLHEVRLGPGEQRLFRRAESLYRELARAYGAPGYGGGYYDSDDGWRRDGRYDRDRRYDRDDWRYRRGHGRYDHRGPSGIVLRLPHFDLEWFPRR